MFLFCLGHFLAEPTVEGHQLTSIDSNISSRIALLRYIMIFGIVILHTPPYVPLTETGSSAFDFLKAFFQHAAFRSSVPVLTFISGFLLFSVDLDKQFEKLFAKKTRTILVPLIAFNLPLALVIYVAQSNQFAGSVFSQPLYPFDLRTWGNAVVGLSGPPVNYPLNFLRDLFIVSLMAPLFGAFLRRFAWVGVFVIFGIFWFNLDKDLVLRNTMPIVFYLGGMAAIHNWNMRKLDKYAIWLFFLFVLFCAAMVLFKIENRNYLRLMSPILIWPAASLLVGTKIGLWLQSISKYSFITFLTHGPILFGLWLAYQKVLAPAPYWIFWFSAPVIAAILAAVVQVGGRRACPQVMRVLLGGRV